MIPNQAGKLLTFRNFGKADYKEVDFRGVNFRGSTMSNAFFSGCDFTGANFRDVIFKLSCDQGAKNKLDRKNVCMFLFWILSVFEVPSDMQRQIENIIGASHKDLVKEFGEV